MIDAPLSYNSRNRSKESDKYNKFHHHLADKIRDIKGTKQSICTGTYLVGYLIKSIAQYVEYCLLCVNYEVTFFNSYAFKMDLLIIFYKILVHGSKERNNVYTFYVYRGQK